MSEAPTINPSDEDFVDAAKRVVDGDVIDTEPVDIRTIEDTDGWQRMIIETPLSGVHIVFKGRFDIPELKKDDATAPVEASLRPLYHDEVTGFGGGIKSEQQISYAGARGTDPRLVMLPGGVTKILERAVAESGGREVFLICDQTPQGFRAMFQAIKELAGDDELSDLARRLCSFRYDGTEAPSEEIQEMFTELSLELAVALTCEDLTPHEALLLVFKSHVGSQDSRSSHSSKLQEILKERIKKDKFGDGKLEDYLKRKQEFVEELKNPERNDFWVHRDRGTLRPGQKVLTGGSYVDYPRTTTHGCLNFAIDIRRNVFGSGGHGRPTAEGSTTIACPMAELVDINGMPVNYEASDTYFVNPEGMQTPEETLYVTVSGEPAPEDLSHQEVWLPFLITSEDLENGFIDNLVIRLSNSIFAKALQAANIDLQTLRNRLDDALLLADIGIENYAQYSSVGSLAKLLDEEVLKMFGSSGSTEEVLYRWKSKLEHTYIQEMGAVIKIRGREIDKFNWDSSLVCAALISYLRQISRIDVKTTGDVSSLTVDGRGILIPELMSTEQLDDESVSYFLSSIEQSKEYRNLSSDKKQNFRQEFIKYISIFKLADFNQIRTTHYFLMNGNYDALEAKARKDLGEHAEKDEVEERIKKLKLEFIVSNGIRVWLTNYFVDTAKLAEEVEEMVKKEVESEKARRRSDYLQVWIINNYISFIRNIKTPTVESMGRGLNWDTPGQVQKINEDMEFAERFSLSPLRHGDHDNGTIFERGFYSVVEEIKEGIEKNPRKVSYMGLIEGLKLLPIHVAVQYIRAGIMSFDQTTIQSDLLVQSQFDDTLG